MEGQRLPDAVLRDDVEFLRTAWRDVSWCEQLSAETPSAVQGKRCVRTVYMYVTTATSHDAQRAVCRAWSRCGDRVLMSMLLCLCQRYEGDREQSAEG